MFGILFALIFYKNLISKDPVIRSHNEMVVRFSGEGDHMERYILVLFGVLTSASAQVMLKSSSGFPAWSRYWVLFLLLSGVFYLVSFCLYLYILKFFPISKIYPIMILCVVCLVTGYGIIIGEHISIRRSIGLLLCTGSIYLLFS